MEGKHEHKHLHNHEHTHVHEHEHSHGDEKHTHEHTHTMNTNTCTNIATSTPTAVQRDSTITTIPGTTAPISTIIPRMDLNFTITNIRSPVFPLWQYRLGKKEEQSDL